MNLTIGTVTLDARTINKDYIVKKSLSNAVVKEDTNIINPTFIISNTNLDGLNYCYCSDWKRYYYIDDIVVMTGGRVAIKCRVDVLMTYKVGIKSLNAIIDKQQNYDKSNMYLDDGSFVMENKTKIETISFDNGFNETGEYILIVGGI